MEIGMEKQYVNGSNPTKVYLRTANTKEGGKTVLSIEFQAPENWTEKYPPTVDLWLDPESNERNVKTINALGAEVPGGELTPNAALDLQISSGPTLVMVGGKPKYINEGRTLKVFDNR